MNVQLILFPQWYNGVPSGGAGSSGSGTTGQIIASSNNFSTAQASLATGFSGQINQIAQIALNSLYATMSPNVWYSYFKNGNGGVDSTAGVLELKEGADGVFQKLNNVTQGGLYDVAIKWLPSYGQTVKVRIFNGTFLNTTIGVVPDVNDEAVFQFTAPSTNNTVLCIDYFSETTFTKIVSVSAKVVTVPPTTPIQTLNNGSVICDLYEDEDLPLTLSIDDFKNAAEQVQSYSKAFNLPATKRNNKIFDQMYEITRSDDGINFNPYKKTKAVLKENGILLFEGYMRMIDITDKEGEISYNVNLYSEVTALADVIGERTFSELDFSELEHDYTYSNIRQSWQGTLPVAALPISSFANNTGVAGATTTNVLKYPFVDWNHQFTVGVSGNPVLPNLESAFRPWIKLKYCIDMIFQATSFSYTSNFFDTGEFGNLYMDFNWGADNAPVIFDVNCQLTRNVPNQALTGSFTTLVFDNMVAQIQGMPATFIPAGFGYSSGVFTAQEDTQVYTIQYNMRFRAVALTTIHVEWVLNGVPISGTSFPNFSVTSLSAGTQYQGSFTTPPLTAGDTILCRAKFTGVVAVDLLNAAPAALGGIQQALVIGNTSVHQTTSSSLLETLRGELGQWEFLKGLMTMFNLVSIPDPDNPTNLLIEPYSDVFITNTAGTNLAARSIQHDWTEKIDISQIQLKPLTDLNLKTIFKFAEDDEDFCFNEYKRQVGGHLYGSLIWTASGFNILTGQEEIVAEPFAATVIKPLESQYSDFIVPAIYARGDDGVCSGFENAPRIMYSNGVRTAALNTFVSCTYSVPAANGGAGDANEDEYLMFSHLSSIPTSIATTADYLFGAQQLAGGIVPVAFNLFTRFWLPYYAQLYHPDTRTMTIKVNLNAGDLAIFKFSDQVMIKNRAFRVNRIDYKPNDLAQVEFILIS